jgi:hypothetical protein
MKKEEGDIRDIVFKLRLNRSEKNQLLTLQQKTTEKDLSAYVRKVSLNDPVMIKYRNASADESLQCMLQLKKELNAIGNNFNQAVKKLHTLDKIPEFRFWIQHHETLHKSLTEKIEEIRITMIKIQETWLHE